MFYENLKRICDEKGTTVTAVLKALNLSTGSTGKWKAGSVPSPEAVEKIAAYLGVSIDDFSDVMIDYYKTHGKKLESVYGIDEEWAGIISSIPVERQELCKRDSSRKRGVDRRIATSSGVLSNRKPGRQAGGLGGVE